MSEALFEWTNLFSRNTGLPVTIWIGVRGVVATDPHHPEKIERADEISAWIRLNRDALLAHWNGDIDGVELALALKPLSA